MIQQKLQFNDLNFIILNNLDKIKKESIQEIYDLLPYTPLHVYCDVYLEILEFHKRTGELPDITYLQTTFLNKVYPVNLPYSSKILTRFLGELRHFKTLDTIARQVDSGDLHKIKDTLTAYDPSKYDMVKPFDSHDMLSQVRYRMSQPRGFKLGIPGIDNVVKGYLPKKTHVIAAPPATYKTTFCVNLAYDAVMGKGTEDGRGLNVVYFSFEIEPYEIYASLYSRHSHEMAKKDKGIVLDNQDIKMGIMAEEEVKRLEQVIADFEQNQKGYIRVLTPSNFEVSMPGIEAILDSTSEELGEVHVVFIDHVNLLKNYEAPGKKDGKDIINYYIHELTKLAKAFNNETGFILFLQVQVNREGIKRLSGSASKNGDSEDGKRARRKACLTLLAEANELERSASTVIILSADDAMKSQGALDIFLVKNRDGAPIEGAVPTVVKPEYCLVGDKVYESIRKKLTGMQGLNNYMSSFNQVNTKPQEKEFNVDDIELEEDGGNGNND